MPISIWPSARYRSWTSFIHGEISVSAMRGITTMPITHVLHSDVEAKIRRKPRKATQPRKITTGKTKGASCLIIVNGGSPRREVFAAAGP